ncbi:unnamed protein product [Penicillium roqueforti FM164]|uniref:Transposable element n=1 Tax=Penicillium roqueforti (strain FM164) TaxID=1365484 RepID=W6QN21_PENRF|nr:unnamed protein product [Penicillium roqueforti FM164]
MPKIKFTILLHHLAINLLPLRHAIIMFPYPAPSVLSIEMTSQHSWFRGPELRSIHRKNPDHSAISYASVKYQCNKHGDASKIAFVRIYKQLPHLGTEFDDYTTRARQARAWTPPELVAYKTLTDKQSEVTPRLLGYREEEQESSALVPAGFLVSLRGSKCLVFS